ncbi:MAG: hypothetical protein MUD15_04390 [Desulfobacterota bacterium]|nr:hypothetical protein [Thermodesulfobacteriota bacterium]
MELKRKWVWVICLAITCLIIPATRSACADGDLMQNAKTVQEDPSEGTQESLGSRQNRIDFGNTYIIGQTIKSGAVYLLQRKKSEIKSMLKYREDYRQEILEGFSADAAKESVREPKQEHSSEDGRQGADRLVSKE